jgi:hypothetical protein
MTEPTPTYDLPPGSSCTTGGQPFTPRRNTASALTTAMAKIEYPTGKTIYLTRHEARALVEYLIAHGLRGDILARAWEEEGP